MELEASIWWVAKRVQSAGNGGNAPKTREEGNSGRGR